MNNNNNQEVNNLTKNKQINKIESEMISWADWWEREEGNDSEALADSIEIEFE